ncbi:unnamed protein product [Eruca vesicaria subsp. sativa]|uniref:FBD domain-containing protein n=1 Tax=Eruca vesicaria subsp. sativa TaxID=29727 RepID=A0ABC8J2J7_ERUVS|nr:unnamed protein product [Eruca vesicaria subsp. sativa]
MDAHFDGTIFGQLEQLKVCTCETEWLDLLMRLLKAAPKLRFIVLELSKIHGIRTEDPLMCWNKPSRVPECLLSSVEYLDWRQYQGTEEEKQVARYILGNSGRLGFATFYPKSKNPVKNLQLLTELSMSPKRSSICQLVFRGNYNPA